MASRSRDGSINVSQQQQPWQNRTNETLSSVSENVARMGLRECSAYEAQLRSLLDAAVAEPPPHGVATAEVEHRMRLIQLALEEVTVRIEELRQAKEERERQRYMDTQRRRMENEEDAERARAVEDKHREELVDEMRLAQVAYYKDKNLRDDDKAVRCREYNEQMQLETMHRATLNEGRRERNLETLKEERERHRQELRAKDLAHRESIKQANRRKALRLERQRIEKERAALIHEQEVEAKLASIRESKRSKWIAKKSASRAKSSVVLKNGRAILETQASDHNKLVEDLENKIKGQQARYADERAEQLLYLQQRAQHRSLRQEKQQTNLLHLIESRLERGEEIVEGAKQKKERAEHTKEVQATQYTEHGAELRKDIAKHRKRAEEIRSQREEEALRKNYRRWNHRAARIIAELNEAVEADENAVQRAAAASAASGHNMNRDQQQPASSATSQRCARLPSPSDFEV